MIKKRILHIIYFKDVCCKKNILLHVEIGSSPVILRHKNNCDIQWDHLFENFINRSLYIFSEKIVN